MALDSHKYLSSNEILKFQICGKKYLSFNSFWKRIVLVMHQNHRRDISWYRKVWKLTNIHLTKYIIFLTIFVSLLYVSDMIAIMPDGSCSCLVCGTAFTSKKNANRHFKEKHTVNREIPEPCYICGKQMRRVRNLVDHLWSIHKISHRQIRAFNASSSKTFPPILPHLQ